MNAHDKWLEAPYCELDEPEEDDNDAAEAAEADLIRSVIEECRYCIDKAHEAEHAGDWTQAIRAIKWMQEQFERLPA